MSLPHDPYHAAAWWHERPPATPEQTKRFDDWLAANPRHPSAFAHLEAAWKAFDRAPHDPAIRALCNQALTQRRRFSISWLRRAWLQPAWIQAAAAIGFVALGICIGVAVKYSPAPAVVERSNILVLNSATLADAVAAINRYSITQIVVADPELAHLLLSGTFVPGRSASFVEGLMERYPVAVVSRSQNQMVLGRIDPDAKLTGL